MRRVLVVVVVSGACGDGLSATDAAPAPDARGGLVSVQFLSDLSPLGDHTVYFQNADTSLVLAGRTMGDGRANAFMAPGGSVTLVVQRGNLVALFTHLAVQPGDELVIDERTTTTDARATTLQIGVPAEPTSTFYDLSTSCGSADIRGAEVAPVTVTLSDCGARADMLVRAFGNGVHYIYRDAVELAPGATVTFAGPYRPLEPAVIQATHVDATIPELTVTHALIGGGRELYREEGRITPAAGAGATVLDVPIPLDGTSMIRIDPAPSGALADHHVIEWGPSARSNVVDLAPTARPILERPRIDLERRAVVWTEAPTGGLADAVLATFQWSPPGSGRNYQWSVVGPHPDDAILHLPILPRAELVPQGNVIDPYIFATISITGGYDRLRPRILGRWSPGRLWPTDGDAGRVAYLGLVP